MMRRAVGMAGKDGKAGKQSLQNKAIAGKHSQRILRPAQASNKRTAHSWPALQQTQQQLQTTSASCRAVQVGGGSAVAGTHEGGLGPT